jgi:putative ABC transport system ATP-binding protein
MKDILDVRELTKTYTLGKVAVTALGGVSFRAKAGEFLAIAGPSGSGKTTLLNLIGGLDVPSSGEIEIDGERLDRLAEARRADLRARKIGFVFQTFNLIPVLTAYENVEYPLLLGKVPKGERRSRVEAALAQVGIADRSRHRPAELSGGQQQRVAIARALVSGPALVLADEPTANLDSRTALEVIDLMRRLNSDRGVTFVFSTHDARIMNVAGRVLRMEDGRVQNVLGADA